MIIPAILNSISHTTDGGLRLGFLTNEMTAEQKLEMVRLHQQFGYLLFQPNSINATDIPKEDAEDKTKTPSKRLRAVLYVLHTQQGGKKEDFETFYRTKTEEIIEHFKGKLDL